MEVLNYKVPRDIDIYEIEKDVFWIKNSYHKEGLAKNTYIIREENESVLIDCGSRDDFPSIAVNVLETKINPSEISAIILTQCELDTCTGLQYFADIINKKNVKIITHKDNINKLKAFEPGLNYIDIEKMENEFCFKTGRKLKFLEIPYSPTSGGIMVFDIKQGILFSSTLFGTDLVEETLFYNFEDEYFEADDINELINKDGDSILKRYLDYHRLNFTSVKALKYAVDMVIDTPYKIVAPRKGYVLTNKKSINFLIDVFSDYEEIGIDSFVG
jgi:flavorubredoxin